MRLPGLDVPKESRLLVFVGLVDAIGTGLYIAGFAVFFTRSAGLSATEVGVGLTVANACGLVAMTPIGMLADRIGPRAASILLHYWRAAGFAAFAFVDDFVGFLVVSCVVGIPTRAIDPVSQMYVDRHIGKDLRVRVMSVMRVVYNIGFSVGGVLTTVILVVGTRPAFLVIVLGNAATFLLAAVLLARVPLLADDPPDRRTARGWPRSLRQGRYLVVTGLNAVLVLNTTVLTLGIPLWIATRTDAPTAVVGPLMVLNTVLVVLLQVRLSRGSDTREGGVRALRWAALAFAAATAVLALSGLMNPAGAVVAVVVATVLLTFGELWHFAGRLSVSYALAPRDRQGEYLSVFWLGSAAALMVGPALITVGVVDRGGFGWLALAAVFAVTGLLVGPAVAAAARQLEKEHPEAEMVPNAT
ncbi:MFS transporter [Actinophytocola sp.]|uniref:MFS transporter n=1 Tax=Actinophytocola sp. TaxID=1872138 RepID=UPI002D33AC14|nr:MFS transporter [Actinophytocola sp.]HYQ66422.1 MFS transporter [Actinophytocola sp.]